jgi:hypothetical protein
MAKENTEAKGLKLFACMLPRPVIMRLKLAAVRNETSVRTVLRQILDSNLPDDDDRMTRRRVASADGSR